MKFRISQYITIEKYVEVCLLDSIPNVECHNLTNPDDCKACKKSGYVCHWTFDFSKYFDELLEEIVEELKEMLRGSHFEYLEGSANIDLDSQWRYRGDALSFQVEASPKWVEEAKAKFALVMLDYKASAKDWPSYVTERFKRNFTAFHQEHIGFIDCKLVNGGIEDD